jgi:hypothetical protein
MNKPNQEQKAEKLWQDYQRGNDAEFWQYYEQLLNKPQSESINNNDDDYPKVFRAEPLSYAWRIIVALLVWGGVLVTLAIILPWDQPASPPLYNDGDFYVIFVIIGFFVAIVPWIHLKDLYVWQVSATKLTVTRWRAKKWHFDLQAIRLVEVKSNPNKGGGSQEIILHLEDNKTVKFNYCLGLDQHWAFLYALHQQGVTTKCKSKVYKVHFSISSPE